MKNSIIWISDEMRKYFTNKPVKSFKEFFNKFDKSSKNLIMESIAIIKKTHQTQKIKIRDFLSNDYFLLFEIYRIGKLQYIKIEFTQSFDTQPQTDGDEYMMFKKIVDEMPIPVYVKKPNNQIYKNIFCAENINEIKIANNKKIYNNDKTLDFIMKSYDAGPNVKAFCPVPYSNFFVTKNLNTKIENITNMIDFPIAIYGNNNKMICCNNLYSAFCMLYEVSSFRDDTFESVFKKIKKQQINVSNISVSNNNSETLYMRNGKVFQSYFFKSNQMNINILCEITAKYKLKREFNNLEQNHNMVLNNINAGIFIIGTNHKIKFMNNCIKKLFKITKNDVYEKNIKEIIDNYKQYFMTDITTPWQNQKENIIHFVTKKELKQHTIKLAGIGLMKTSCIPITDGSNVIILEKKDSINQIITTDNKGSLNQKTKK